MPSFGFAGYPSYIPFSKYARLTYDCSALRQDLLDFLDDRSIQFYP